MIRLLALLLTACSVDSSQLYDLECEENGEQCMGACCDPRARCRAPDDCVIGVCVVGDAGTEEDKR
jgi:hypothetical protein